MHNKSEINKRVSEITACNTKRIQKARVFKTVRSKLEREKDPDITKPATSLAAKIKAEEPGHAKQIRQNEQQIKDCKRINREKTYKKTRPKK